MHERNPKHAFLDAIHAGVLTEDTAPLYMYMYTTPEAGDHFKHIITRKYIANNNIRFHFDVRIK